MEIIDYIIRGGENLNNSAHKTSSFPDDAEVLFNLWHSKLGKDDEETDNFFELPVNAAARLFLRAFWTERPGHRPICYYVGLLIPRSLYEQGYDYFKISCGICNISLQDVKEAQENNFAPIASPADIPMPRSTIGLDFSQLAQVKLYGEDGFAKNLNDMRLSISINNLEDWFSRLFIAVNPYRLDSSFNVIVSKKEPHPAIKGADMGCLSKKNKDRDMKQQMPMLSGDLVSGTRNEPKVFRINIFYAIFVFLLIWSCGIGIYHFVICGKNLPLPEQYRLQAENENLKQVNEDLMAKCEKLDRENIVCKRENSKLKHEIDKLRSQRSNDRKDTHLRMTVQHDVD